MEFCAAVVMHVVVDAARAAKRTTSHTHHCGGPIPRHVLVCWCAGLTDTLVVCLVLCVRVSVWGRVSVRLRTRQMTSWGCAWPSWFIMVTAFAITATTATTRPSVTADRLQQGTNADSKPPALIRHSSGCAHLPSVPLGVVVGGVGCGGVCRGAGMQGSRLDVACSGVLIAFQTRSMGSGAVRWTAIGEEGYA
eukprot:1390251-Rhodomonas_salina.2